MSLVRALALLLPFALAAGCSWFGAGVAEQALREGFSAPAVIPEGLDEPDFVDLMPIPDIVDYRGLGDVDLEVGLPDALSTQHGVDKIVIRKLGDVRWVFVDLPTAIVWPEVVAFWEQHDLPVASLDPRNGVVETEWLPADGGSPAAVMASILKDTSAIQVPQPQEVDQPSIQEEAASSSQAPGPDSETAQAATAPEGGEVAPAEPAPSEEESAPPALIEPSQHRFRARVEPGVRNGSTEIYVDHKLFPVGAPYRVDEVDWSTGSDNLELEGEALKALAYFLGDHVAEDPSVSMLAAEMQGESKATLEARPGGAVLRYKLDFNRAWATVGAALEDARVKVEDLDRSLANYYVHFTSKHDSRPGFFSRLFTFGDDEDEEEAANNRFTVHLETVEGEVHVRVASERESEGAEDKARTLLLTERLLKLIREYSS